MLDSITLPLNPLFLALYALRLRTYSNPRVWVPCYTPIDAFVVTIAEFGRPQSPGAAT